MSSLSPAPVFLHADLDAFYASVEQHDRPELKGKPVVVGGLPGRRGVVSACSYEARAFGVRSAMPVSQAVRRCPQAIFLPVRMERYLEVSTGIMTALTASAPSFLQISIDEAFLDLSGTERLLGPPRTVAKRIKDLIRENFGLTLSIGIAPNRFLAKLASQYRKPDGLYEVRPGDEEAFLDTLAPADLLGVGKKTAERLRELNLITIPAIRSLDEGTLIGLFGKAGGRFLFRAVRGEDPGFYSEHVKSRSISSEITFEQDRRDFKGLKKVLLLLSHQVMFRLLEEKKTAKTVAVKYRLENFETYQTQVTVDRRLCSAEEVYRLASELLFGKWNGKTPLRLLGVGLSHISDVDSLVQPDLFEEQDNRKQKLEEAILAVRKKFATTHITKARLMTPDEDDDRPRSAHR
ncbi:MAG TPA: DNA polymerase IV [Spirochaetia bacterium]|nr:DNA polymerase IV [Spirochaetia bacterium]